MTRTATSTAAATAAAVYSKRKVMGQHAPFAAGRRGVCGYARLPRSSSSSSGDSSRRGRDSSSKNNNSSSSRSGSSRHCAELSAAALRLWLLLQAAGRSNSSSNSSSSRSCRCFSGLCRGVGLNDGGRNQRDVDKLQEAFLDFLGVSKESPRRSRRGVHSLHLFPQPVHLQQQQHQQQQQQLGQGEGGGVQL
ncbi:hypothetical protein Esti_001225 [Eimeria stiedai]